MNTTPDETKDELGRTVCSACNGRGRKPKLDVMKAESGWDVCEKCGGSGFDGPEEGLYVVPIRGQPIYYQWFKKGKVVSQITLIAVPCVMKNPKTKEVNKHITIELFRIWTHEKHRKQGIMTDMIKKLKAGFQGQVRFIITNWQDSTVPGREVLLKAGFDRNGSLLMWDRDNPDN